MSLIFSENLRTHEPRLIQTHRPEKETQVKRDKEIERERERERERETDRQTDRQTDTETDRQTGRQGQGQRQRDTVTDRDRDREADRHKDLHAFFLYKNYSFAENNNNLRTILASEFQTTFIDAYFHPNPAN